MSKLLRIGYLFSPKTIRFIHPCWKQEQWNIVLSLSNRPRFSASPRYLENEFVTLSGASYARSFNLGRTAIQVALESFHLPAESEVILPSYSCAGVITPVMFAGFVPVLVDIDRDFNILASSVKAAISSRTQAIILPLLSGKLAEDFDQILDLANKRNIKVIVDATQALGLTISDNWPSFYGDACIFSFNGGKLIPSSGGGVLLSNNEEVISHCQNRLFPTPNTKESNRRISQYIWKHGMKRVSYPLITIQNAFCHMVNSKFPCQQVKQKSHAFNIEDMDSIEAELALSQMKFIPEIIDHRRRNAIQLINSNILQDLDFRIPTIENNIFNKFLITHENPDFSHHVRKILLENGIETEQSYIPLSLRKICLSARTLPTPNTDQYWKAAFSIPIHPNLDSEDMNRIIHVLKTML